MASVTATISEETEQLLDGAVAAGLYTGRSDGIRDALRSYLESNPELARAVAVELYAQDQLDRLTASQFAGVSVEEFDELTGETDG